MRNSTICHLPASTDGPPQASPWRNVKERLLSRHALVGMAVTSAPTVAFVIANATLSLPVAIAIASSTAILVVSVRAIRREPLTGALAGVVLVIACAGVALVTGEARGFFLVPTVIPFAIVVACVGSVLARRPLSGMVLNRVVGGPSDWRENPGLRRVYAVSTLAFAGVNVISAAVQVPMYLWNETSILALSHLVTQPVFLAIVAVTVVAARRVIVAGGRR